jgi:TPR repeat protein
MDSIFGWKISVKLKGYIYQLGMLVGIGLVLMTVVNSGECSEESSALKNYRLDAESGDAEAQSMLGYMYLTGEGSVLQDYTMALSWFSKAAEQGNWFAQFKLGEMYYYGVGVNQNYAEALKWYRKSAAQGILKAEFSVANMYRKGEGGEHNYKLALKWYQVSAEKGFSNSQYRLAEMYHEGMGVPVDQKKAYVWYSIASRESQEKGNQEIQTQAMAAIDNLKTVMTPEQISEAERETAVMWKKLQKRNSQTLFK